MAQVVWLPAAIEDLESIRAFVAATSEPRATELLRRIREATLRLEAFPQSGRIVPEGNDPAFRELIVPTICSSDCRRSTPQQRSRRAKSSVESRSGSSNQLPHEAVGLHLAVKVGAFEADRFGGAAHVAAEFGELALEELPLEGGARFAQGR